VALRAFPRGATRHDESPGPLHDVFSRITRDHDITDPEHGGSYTVKVWESDKTVDEDGWRHREIRLAPDSDNASFEPIIVRSADESLQVIAEMLEVLPGRTD
jgi:uncharacterized protein